MKIVIEQGQRIVRSPLLTYIGEVEDIELPGQVRFVEYQGDQLSVYIEANPDTNDDEMPIEAYIIDCDTVAERVQVWDLRADNDVTKDNYAFVGHRVSVLA